MDYQNSSSKNKQSTADCGVNTFREEHADSNKPPLMMQSSNLPIPDGLDIGHDGGGMRTSDDSSNWEQPKKRKKKDANSNSKMMKVDFESENSLKDKSSLDENYEYPESEENKDEQSASEKATEMSVK